MLVTVLTPSYNRANKLLALFLSLLKQSCLDFIWLVVDDGSDDNTKEVVDNFIASNPPFLIQYIYKANGGKHTALNVGIELIGSELTFIVDSDDILTSDAIESIKKDWKKYGQQNLCGIGYLRGYINKNSYIGDKYPQDYLVDTFINVRYNKNINGDKAEVWVTKYLKENPFPEYKNEKFISESVVWIKMAIKHPMLFVNKVIYQTEYLEGGLTKTGRILRFKSPKGMSYGSLLTMRPEFSLKIRIKETLLYIVYNKFGNKSIREIMKCPYRKMVVCCYLPGLVLYRYWKKKYGM